MTKYRVLANGKEIVVAYTVALVDDTVHELNAQGITNIKVEQFSEWDD